MAPTNQDPVEYAKQNEVVAWEIELLDRSGLRWACLAGPTLESVRNDLAVDQRFEEFYCRRIKKSDAPCEHHTWLQPRGPIAVIKAADRLNSDEANRKARAKRADDAASGIRVLVKTLLDVKLDRLPTTDVLDTPLKTYIDNLRAASDKAAKLRGDLGSALERVDDRLSDVVSNLDALRATSTELGFAPLSDNPQSLKAGTPAAAIASLARLISGKVIKQDAGMSFQEEVGCVDGVVRYKRTTFLNGDLLRTVTRTVRLSDVADFSVHGPDPEATLKGWSFVRMSTAPGVVKVESRGSDGRVRSYDDEGIGVWFPSVEIDGVTRSFSFPVKKQ